MDLIRLLTVSHLGQQPKAGFVPKGLSQHPRCAPSRSSVFSSVPAALSLSAGCSHPEDSGSFLHTPMDFFLPFPNKYGHAEDQEDVADTSSQ